MSTADWGIWTDPPGSKTASAQIPFAEYNNMIASGNLGYLVTGLQNTSLGHMHDGRDSRGIWKGLATATRSGDAGYPNAMGWTNISGWSAVLTAPASALLRYHLAIDVAVVGVVNAASYQARAVINGTAYSAQAYRFQCPGGGAQAAWEWWTAVPSGVVSVVGQLSGGTTNETASIGARIVIADLMATG